MRSPVRLSIFRDQRNARRIAVLSSETTETSGQPACIAAAAAIKVS